MDYKHALDELQSAIEYSKNSTLEMFEKLEVISSHADEKVIGEINDVINLIQSQDIFTQRIQRVMNDICEEHGIDSSAYHIAPSAKHLDGDEDEVLSNDEIEALIKQMS